jgi:sec-independent protein translocase protein TatB
MFDVSFWELMIIGVIALVVVGPERLPGLMRTVGLWVGKARAAMSSLREEVEREVNAQGLRDTERALRGDIERTIHDAGRPLRDAGEDLEKTGRAAADAVNSTRAAADSSRPPPASTEPASAPAEPASAHSGTEATPAAKTTDKRS